MKQTLYFVVFFLLWGNAFTQDCPDFPRLLKEGNALRTKGQYRPALNKYNAAKLCDPSKSAEVDKLITTVFDAIEKEKEEAVKQRDLAQKATKEAQKQTRIAQEKTNDATALYWASEAEKFVPKNAMRMLEAAAKKQTSTKTLNLIKEKNLSLFNQSNNTQFQETHSIPFDEYVTPQVSPDSKWLVLRNNEAFTVYDLLKKSLWRRFSEAAIDTDFSPSAQWFVVSKDTHIDIYSTEKWECLTTLQTKGDRRFFTTFSTDEKWLLIDQRDGTFLVFNTSTWLKNTDFDKYSKIESVEFSPDGKWLSIEVEKNNYKIVSLNSGKELITGPDSMFTNVDFSPDGKWLSIEVEKNNYKIVSLNSGKELIIGLDSTRNSVEFSPDSKWIVTKVKDSLLKIYELSTGKEMFLSANYAIEFVEFSTDGKFIFIQSNFGSNVYRKDSLGYGILSIITDKVSNATFSPDNQHLALISIDKILKIYELTSGKCLPFYFNDKIQDIRWSPNSDLFITKNKKGIVTIYDSKSIHEIKPPKKRNGIGRIQLQWGEINLDLEEIEFSQNGRWMSIYTHYNDESKYLIFDCDKKEFNTFVQDAKPIFFSNSRELLFIQDKNVRILNLKKNSISKFIEQENVSMVNSYVGVLFNKWIVTSGLTDFNFKNISNGFAPSFLKFKSIFGYSASNDKKWLGIRTLYGVLEVFNLETELKHNIIPKNEKVDLMGFAPNSQLFFSYINDTIRIRQIKDGKIIGTYNIGKNIKNIEFSPDNQWLLVQIKDGTGLIYDIETGQTPRLLQEESRSKKDTLTWFISFQPDGNKTIVFKPDERKTMIQKQDWEDFFKKILFDTTLQYNKNTTFLVIAKYDSTLEIENFSLADLYKLGFEVDYCFFSNDSKWVYLAKDWGGVVENGKFNTIPDFLQNENKITMTYFSPDSQWMLIEKLDGTNKIFNLGTKKPYNFLPKDKDIGLAKFSQNSQYISTVSNHKITTWELATGKPIQTLWVNKKPKQIDLIDNRYLFVVVGKAILKMDLQTQRGNFFSYGDGEPLDYTYEEIVEWMKVFGDEYLGPLSEEIKEKYGIKD